MLQSLLLAALLASLPISAAAQDAVKADPKHYQVISENDHVRILRIHYGPHEKSVMHDHPATVAVTLTDSNIKFTLPEGKTAELHEKAGAALYRDADKHQPENMSDKPFEAILVELKTPKAAARK